MKKNMTSPLLSEGELPKKLATSFHSDPVLKASMKAEEMAQTRLLHELQVHQIELEMQNQQLIAAMHSAEQAASDYAELYESAPIGYITLDLEGKITRANLCAAQLLGKDRRQLQGKPLTTFIAKVSKPIFASLFSSSNIQSASLNSEIVLEKTRSKTVLMEISLSDNNSEYRVVLTDISERKEVEQALIKSEESLRKAQAIASLGSWEWDINNDEVTWSDEQYRIFGIKQKESTLSHHHFINTVNDEDRANVIKAIDETLAGNKDYDVEYRICRKDGRERVVNSKATVERDTDGNPLRMIGFVQDITERKQIEEKLKRAASVFSHTQEGIMITDANAIITEVNDTFTSITGYSAKEALGKNASLLQSGRQSPLFYTQMWEQLLVRGQWRGEIWNRRKNGEFYPGMLTINAVKDNTGEVQHYVGLCTDTTSIKAYQEELKRVAHYDSLTNLPNRVLLADRLQQGIVQCQRRKCSLAVAFIDLDGFKAINDKYGHNVGDELLIAVSKRMSEALREGDTLARIGGDEFVAGMVDLENNEDSTPLLERILKAASSPVTVNNNVMQVSASIGIAFYPQDGVDADKLMRRADQAMYVAKQAGRNRYHQFDVAQDNKAKSQLKNINELRLAFQRNEFVLYYQPKVNMRNGDVIGVEALIRWRHPERGFIRPIEFMTLIDSHPHAHTLCLEIGDWVIHTALSQISQWQRMGLNLPISVNVSAYQIQKDDFVAHLADILAEYSDVDPGCLTLEILETSALSDISRVSKTMEACSSIGLNFALDDFGTGYSSLEHLRHLPAKLIKIDQSFVHNMQDNTDDLAIVTSIIGLAKAFKREVIAEGAGTKTQIATLLELGCDFAQGYGIAPPMPADYIPEWSANWRINDYWQASDIIEAT